MPSRCATLLLLFVTCIGWVGRSASADDAKVANPLYNYWSKHAVGSSVTLVEETTYAGEDKKFVPGGVDRKVISYELLSVSADSVVVRVVAVERAFLGFIESAPTKLTYPSQVEKSAVETFLFQTDAETGEEELTVADKPVQCKTLSGTVKSDGAEVSYKVWHSDTIPGGILKQVRSTRQEGKVVAETTISLLAYKKAE